MPSIFFTGSRKPDIEMNVFGIIPARGGSKRIPRKNIVDFGGKPLIAHTIEQANQSSVLNRCIVSTDDDEIAKVAREYGGNVPFRRPDKLATDTASSAAVVSHALKWVQSEGYEPSIVVILQVTSPFREVDDIDAAIRRLQNHKDAASIVSVTEYSDPPEWALKIGENGLLQARFSEHELWDNNPPRSQDTDELYCPNGAIFGVRVKDFRSDGQLYSAPALGYEMPVERSPDIDEPYDLEVARALYEYRSE
ncbi:cytidylyltransferase domain-containing protein [Halosimplex pelagicum]|uniref:Acylneuraminate cytidylyltransferase family protein n=1 Tax=Halosimplex pelagicum TaxID=869886 RepID=A0A7D5T8R0_9EURY|nr:acylneuraminate cytidylyltransferase family protein [Halosimplex pelagicum]QLH81210.1 acylneuraminate cytidylyltransferase family protein [Halosimplex pelagicum]